MSNNKIRRAWDSCWRTTADPYAEDWAYLCSWPSPVKDGFYCWRHAEAIEQVSIDGGFQEEAGAS